MSEIQAELPPLEERPLVTFALFAYNQEKYIREAIEGAFAQTYEPLEIILSDDCSTDRTFEIMEEMVAGYSGIHKVSLNRNPRNLGVAAHIDLVAQKTVGEIVIMAAGDDVSHPERTRLTVRKFSCCRDVFAVFTDLENIDESGCVIDRHSKAWEPGRKITLPQLIRNGGGVGTGATYAYRRECFAWPWSLPDFVVSEDRILPLRAACLGRIGHIPFPLVRYRSSTNSLSALLSKTGQLAMENRAHLEELKRTIKEAFNEGRLRLKDLSLYLRIIEELPSYGRFLQELGKKKEGLTVREVVIENWYHRETFLRRFISKIFRIKRVDASLD